MLKQNFMYLVRWNFPRRRQVKNISCFCLFLIVLVLTYHLHRSQWTHEETQVDFSLYQNDTWKSPSNTKKIALFVQGYGIDDEAIWKDITQCIRNVGEAKKLADEFSKYPWVDFRPPEPFEFDVFISHKENTNFTDINLTLEPLGVNRVFSFPILVNEGYDIKQFLEQLELAENLVKNETSSNGYQSFLKIHSKSHARWRRVALESLCGTPGNVLTALRTLGSDPNIGMISPQGYLVQRSLSTVLLAQVSCSNYKLLFENIFNVNMANMQLLYQKMFSQKLDSKSDLAFSAGTMFWCRYEDFHVDDWVKMMPWMSDRWSSEFQHDGQIEHAIERMFGIIPFLNNVTIAEIGVPVKPIGIYHLQYLLP